MGRDEVYEVQGDVVRKKQNITLKQFIWNPETKTVCGRGGRSWALVGIFYLVFYGILALIFSVMMYALVQLLEDDKPNINYYDNGQKHSMLNQPGLGFQPVMEKWRNKYYPIIKYEISDAESYEDAVNVLESNVQGYSENVTITSCDGSSSSICSLHIDDLGPCDGRDDPYFGYSTGEPCVILKLNKIIGWNPVQYTSNPDSSVLGERWNSTHIGVSCTQQRPLIGEDECPGCMGEPEYYPPSGFPLSCFPYCGRRSSSDYSSPLVMVKFRGITVGEKINVGCRAWASNLEYDEKDKAASVFFAIEIES